MVPTRTQPRNGKKPQALLRQTQMRQIRKETSNQPIYRNRLDREHIDPGFQAVKEAIQFLKLTPVPLVVTVRVMGGKSRPNYMIHYDHATGMYFITDNRWWLPENNTEKKNIINTMKKTKNPVVDLARIFDKDEPPIIVIEEVCITYENHAIVKLPNGISGNVLTLYYITQKYDTIKKKLIDAKTLVLLKARKRIPNTTPLHPNIAERIIRMAITRR